MNVVTKHITTNKKEDEIMIIITSQVQIIIKIITLTIKEIICCVKISQEFKENQESNFGNFIIVFLCHLWYYASRGLVFSATIDNHLVEIKMPTYSLSCISYGFML